MRSAQSGDCVLPPAGHGARRYEANYRGIEGKHRAQCACVRRWREEHTLVKRQSWGPSNDGGLRMVNWESQSKTPPQSPEDGHIYCILLIRIAFCHVSENLPLRCLFYVTINNYFCFYIKTARDVVTVLPIFAEYSSLHLHIFTCTYRGTHTHKHTCTISPQEEQPGTGAWLRGAEERLC